MTTEQLTAPPAASWATRTYRVQTAATVVSGLGNAAAPIATAFAVLAGGGGTAEVGYVTGARLLPTVLFLLLGGALADRLPRHRVMVAANGFNALTQALLAALVLSGHAGLWALLVLSAAGGIGQAFYGPASQGVIMASIAPEHSTRAFSLYRMAQNAAQIGGAALGGALTAAVGPGWVLAIDALGFAVAAALRLLIPAEEAGSGHGGTGILTELREGWREFIGRQWLWAIVVQFGIVTACVEAAETVYGPVVAEQRLGGASAWGLAMAAFGLGMVLTGIPMTAWRPRRILLAGNWGVFLFACPALALALHLSLPLIATAMFASGAGVTLFGVNWMIALQQEIPPALLSRVSAYDSLGSICLTPLGTVLAGPAATALTLDGALWTCALTTFLLAALALLAPEVRTLARTEPTPTEAP
ncbi:MFS transporter [Kitasatospora sp. MMS16-BH015]|uniref:MFS transporter n=1 Tax=Kitasatospora sp. MMS16-BH015 TaxID=2018025 RepID=UPI000CA0A089|nr:MFS transporter [Kitasatospora sp. MMS16-BH015]AUG81432.1 MFS transporter [Kitasatospora sp. MMS16-BH015]